MVVSVTCIAISSKSISSSDGLVGILSYIFFGRIRWQVEHASVPSHAPKPSMSTSLSKTASKRVSPTLASIVFFPPLKGHTKVSLTLDGQRKCAAYNSGEEEDDLKTEHVNNGTLGCRILLIGL
uniref:Uncharacterized protein n=1 Tax=Schistocephalus solidus TaxID=70667 RepID=A0A0X3PJG1_SCHSO